MINLVLKTQFKIEFFNTVYRWKKMLGKTPAFSSAILTS